MAVQQWSEKDARDADLRATFKLLSDDELRAMLWEIVQRLTAQSWLPPFGKN